LVRQKNYSIEILPAPISREESGVARISRNERLSDKGRQEAASIYRALMDARNSQKTSWTELTDVINRSLSDSITLEYFALAQEDTLQTIEEIEPNKPTRAFIAVELEGVRLIDNLPMY
jgi:pantoate--beta-alanine ligase